MTAVASIAYVPPKEFGHPASFLANLDAFNRTHPLLLYTARDDIPDAIKIRSPDELKHARFPDGKPNPFAVNNAVFLTGMRIAKSKGYSHVCYLEADCRVGRDDWDGVIFDEYFNLGKPCIAAGTLVAYNPCTWSALSARRWHELIVGNPRKNYPVATYGWQGASKPRTETCLFPNGALGVYSIPWMDRLFDLDKTVEIARQQSAWDMLAGVRIWQCFQEDSYEVLGFLNSIYSGFGEIITSEEDRREMLVSGKVVAVHQIKSDWSYGY